MRKTIRNVTIVVPVLMTSCHVSLKPKKGPEMAHNIRTAVASENAPGRPAARDVHLANRVKMEGDFFGFMLTHPGIGPELADACFGGYSRVACRPRVCRVAVPAATERPLLKSSLRPTDPRHTIQDL
jgi:hypothetical protein